MIGDWVYNAHHKRNIRITPYDFFTHGHYSDGSQFIIGMGRPALGRDLEPIPLSKEILEKNGFVINRGPTSWKFETEREDLIDIYGCRDYHLSINIEDTHGSGKGYRWMLNDFVIHYVHELQHALRLFRIKKEIVL